MTKRCLDEEILQGYLDGELSPEMMAQAGAHLSECAECAEALATAASELEMFGVAFAPDPNLSVPTANLRARIDAAVAELERAPENHARPNWNLRTLLTPLSVLFDFAPQRAAAFATVLAAVAFALLFAVVLRQRPQTPLTPGTGGAREVAVVTQTREDAQPETAVKSENESAEEVNDKPLANATEAKIVRVSERRAVKTSAAPLPKNSNGGVRPARDEEAAPKLLPGEKQYLEVIASLDKSIKAGGDAVLRPAVRVDYERNLALLEQTIKDTRRVALRNPKDTDAVNFLLSAYQNKVDLLNTVAEQAQVATLGR